MRKYHEWVRMFAFVLSLGIVCGAPAGAFNQPPVNLSATTFLDGGAPQGFYYLNYGLFTKGNRMVDDKGNRIPGNASVTALVNLHQFYYISKIKFLGASVALDVALPLAAVSMRGQVPVGPPAPPGTFVPLAGNTAGLGDLLVGPALHWDGHSLLGGPVFHRVESDWIFPTGKYDKNWAANPGSNLRTVSSYYSFVWFFHPRWETSWRLWYTFHRTNKDHFLGTLQPGRLFHVNYAASYALTPKWRVGAAGYHLRQLTDDRVNGLEVADQREMATAIGPGLVYMGPGFTAMLSHPREFGVRNRFKGSRTTLQIIHKF